MIHGSAFALTSTTFCAVFVATQLHSMVEAMEEDVALAALLTAIEDLHNIRNEMHTCIKQASVCHRVLYHTFGMRKTS